METTPKEFSLVFVKKEKVVQDAYAFYFDRSRVEFDFLPGQYVKMTLDIPHPDERGSTHSFSIASSPLQKDFIRIITKIGKSTFKQALITLTPGQQIQFLGPKGKFVLQEEDKGPHVFLAGGIGITPFLNMIPYAAEKNLNKEIILLASFSTTEDVIGYEELKAFESSHIKIIYTISQPQESQPKADRPLAEKWNGETGRISQELIKKYVQDITKPLFYIVGPPKMVEAIVQVVQSMNVAEDRILKESFIGY